MSEEIRIVIPSVLYAKLEKKAEEAGVTVQDLIIRCLAELIRGEKE